MNQKICIIYLRNYKNNHQKVMFLLYHANMILTDGLLIQNILLNSLFQQTDHLQMTHPQHHL